VKRERPASKTANSVTNCCFHKPRKRRITAPALRAKSGATDARASSKTKSPRFWSPVNAVVIRRNDHSLPFLLPGIRPCVAAPVPRPPPKGKSETKPYSTSPTNSCGGCAYRPASVWIRGGESAMDERARCAGSRAKGGARMSAVRRGGSGARLGLWAGKGGMGGNGWPWRG